jgi:hypothetical protein
MHRLEDNIKLGEDAEWIDVAVNAVMQFRVLLIG